jgi:thiamine biosynthesis lipoprotein
MSAAARVAPFLEARFRSMGTDVTVLVPPDAGDADQLARETFVAWNDRFSRFQPDSELSALNRAAGTPFVASAELFEAARTALAAARATDGLFDPLLAGRMAELGYDRTFDALPPMRTGTGLAAWIPGLWRQVVLDAERRTIQLPAGSGLDLGGIAKGMAVDAALARIVGAGVPYAAVNAGGDLAVHGLPPGLEAWTIVVDGAGGRNVTLPRGGLATSTVLLRRWNVDGDERHHLIDPRTGLSSTSDVVLASVAAASCTQAEVAAKAALLAGSLTGAAFVREQRLAGLMVTADGSIRRIGRWSDDGEGPAVPR